MYKNQNESEFRFSCKITLSKENKTRRFFALFLYSVDKAMRDDFWAKKTKFFVLCDGIFFHTSAIIHRKQKI